MTASFGVLLWKKGQLWRMPKIYLLRTFQFGILPKYLAVNNTAVDTAPMGCFFLFYVKEEIFCCIFFHFSKIRCPWNAAQCSHGNDLLLFVSLLLRQSLLRHKICIVAKFITSQEAKLSARANTLILWRFCLTTTGGISNIIEFERLMKHNFCWNALKQTI